MAKPFQIFVKGTDYPYQSRDLRIGTPQLELQPPFNERHADVEQFDPRIQAQAFEFVKADVTVELAKSLTMLGIEIQGIGRRFYHYQLYAAFWMLLNERGERRGCIEADSMGLGKTCTALLYIILNSLIAANARHLREHPDEHLAPSLSGLSTQTPSSRCPSSHRFAIQCACEEFSVTRALGQRQGASIVFVPASLLDSWVREWDSLEVSPQLEIRLYIHHRAYADRSVPRWQWRHLQLHSPPARVPSDTPTLCAPSYLSHQFVVLTTLESYHSRVARYQSEQHILGLNHSSRTANCANDGLAWGRILLDESQLRANFRTEAFAILRSLVHNDWVKPNFVALTGTPMLRNGVGDMIPVINMINLVSPALRDSTRYSKFTNSEYLNSLAATYTAYVNKVDDGNSDDDVDTGRQLISDVGELLALYCIRRHSGTVQNNRVLAQIPPLERLDIVCPSPINLHQLPQVSAMLCRTRSPEWISQLERWERRGQDIDHFLFGTSLLLDNIQLTRVVSTIPALAGYAHKSDLSWRRIEQQKWHTSPAESPFYSRINELAASSGKLQTLGQIFQLLRRCRTWDGQPEKCVVVSEFPIICHVVACFCHRNRVSCAWLHAGLSVAERADLIRSFQGRPSLENPARPTHMFRVLLGTSRLIGQGITLNRAQRLVIMEPSYHAGVELQNADRIHRIGSMTDRDWVYRLLNPDSSLERFLVQRQNIQRRFHYGVEWLYKSV